MKNCKPALTRMAYVQVICDEERSQYLNKEIALERLIVLLTNALHKPKVRKPSKVSRAAKLARLGNKKMQSLKKTASGTLILIKAV
jgi:ribosome-associated protein